MVTIASYCCICFSRCSRISFLAAFLRRRNSRQLLLRRSRRERYGVDSGAASTSGVASTSGEGDVRFLAALSCSVFSFSGIVRGGVAVAASAVAVAFFLPALSRAVFERLIAFSISSFIIETAICALMDQSSMLIVLSPCPTLASSSCNTCSQAILSVAKTDRMRDVKSLYALTEISYLFSVILFPFFEVVVFIAIFFCVVN